MTLDLSQCDDHELSSLAVAGQAQAFRCAQSVRASWRTKWTQSLILLKDLRDRMPFSVTLDTVYMDSKGVGIYIINIIKSKSLSLELRLFSF